MLEQVLNPVFLRSALAQLRAYVAAGQPVVATTRDGEALPPVELEPRELEECMGHASEELAKHEAAARAVRRGEADPEAGGDGGFLIAGSAALSNLQAAIEEYYSHTDAKDQVEEDVDRNGGLDSPARGGERIVYDGMAAESEGKRVFGPFQQTDLAWISALFAKGMRAYKGPHAFFDRPQDNRVIKLPDENLRIIVVGDWGSGIPRAIKVKDAIRRELDAAGPGCSRHVVHLGDVYYAGYAFEYRKRFLTPWPVRPDEWDKIGSYTLNGNHDMYSGGYGYFDVALRDPRFAKWQGQSSLFQMGNRYWQLFGLDTSWEDGALHGDQAEWVRGALQPGKKAMLLSHHQYCSVYEDAPSGVIAGIAPLLQTAPVKAWLWGHEHRCMTYKKVGAIDYPRCIGHGGVPVYQLHNEADPTPEPGAWEFRDYQRRFIERWATFGFAVLDFERQKVTVRYLDENGKENHLEEFV